MDIKKTMLGLTHMIINISDLYNNTEKNASDDLSFKIKQALKMTAD